MRKNMNPEKDGLVVRSIIAEAEGNSVYSLPHIYISKKLLGSLKLKWGQSIVLSTGLSRNMKTCKAFVFGSESLTEKETKASSGVCKELNLHEKDTLQIEGCSSMSLEQSKLKKRTSPQLTLPLTEEINPVGNQLFLFGKNNEIQVIGKMIGERLKVQVKEFKDMKVYTGEVNDRVGKLTPKQIFNQLRDGKEFSYNADKKLISTNQNTELKLKKCQNSLRWIQNQIIFHTLHEIQNRLSKFQEANKPVLKVQAVTQSEGSQSTVDAAQEDIKSNDKKMNKKREANQLSRAEDYELTTEVLKLQKKIKELEHQVSQLKKKDKKLEKGENNLSLKQFGVNEMWESFFKHSQMAENQPQPNFASLNSRQDSEELKLRVQKLESQFQGHIEKETSIEKKLKEEMKKYYEKTKKIIDKLDEKEFSISCDLNSISFETERENSVPLSKQKIKIDFQSKYINEFIIEGTKVIRMGSKGWTQLLCTNIVPSSTLARYQMKIVNSKYNFIMFGLISKDYVNEKSSWTSEQCYDYFAWNGNAYIEGECVVKQGRGFRAEEKVSMEVYLQGGIIRWKVNDDVVYEAKRPNLKKISKNWVPYIQMFSPGDSIQFLNENFEQKILL